jgi:hypothetical protein
MVDPNLIVDEFMFSLPGNLATAFIVAALMLGIAVIVPRRWKWWVAFPIAVIVGLCITIAFILIGMRVLYKVGAAFAVHFGPIHLAIAILLSGVAFAVVRKRSGPAGLSDVPKPDSWYDR